MGTSKEGIPSDRQTGEIVGPLDSSSHVKAIENYEAIQAKLKAWWADIGRFPSLDNLIGRILGLWAEQGFDIEHIDYNVFPNGDGLMVPNIRDITIGGDKSIHLITTVYQVWTDGSVTAEHRRFRVERNKNETDDSAMARARRVFLVNGGATNQKQETTGQGLIITDISDKDSRKKTLLGNIRDCTEDNTESERKKSQAYDHITDAIARWLGIDRKDLNKDMFPDWDIAWRPMINLLHAMLLASKGDMSNEAMIVEGTWRRVSIKLAREVRLGDYIYSSDGEGIRITVISPHAIIRTGTRIREDGRECHSVYIDTSTYRIDPDGNVMVRGDSMVMYIPKGESNESNDSLSQKAHDYLRHPTSPAFNPRKRIVPNNEGISSFSMYGPGNFPLGNIADYLKTVPPTK